MKKSLIALACGLTLFGSSCLGPNNLWESLHGWNGKATNSKIVNELIFIGLNFIPVYGICYLGDIIIFNSIEWWGGNNPISVPEPFESQKEMGF